MQLNDTFEGLLKVYNENKFSHCYLFETNNIEKCLFNLKNFIKIINKDIPNISELIDNNYFPSLKIIEPLNGIIKKEEIDNLKDSFSLSSIYSSNKIYIIEYPELMNSSAYNKMLKFLEEPEDNIIGFFITKSKENIAPTILSRCELIRDIYNDEKNNKLINNLEYEKYIDYANKYIEILELDYKNIFLYTYKVILKEFNDKKQITCLLKVLYDIYEKDFHAKKKYKNVEKKLKILSKYLYEIQYNLNLNLMLDSMALEIGEIND